MQVEDIFCLVDCKFYVPSTNTEAQQLPLYVFSLLSCEVFYSHFRRSIQYMWNTTHRDSFILYNIKCNILSG